MAAFTKYEDRRAWTHVVAAAVVDPAGRILIAERPRHKAHGGLWEFPGGKREHGETPAAALKREFREEVGLELEAGRPLIRVQFEYPERSLILDVWRVDSFVGEAVPREGQQLRWVPPRELREYRFPAANQPVVAALNLPETLWYLPAPAHAHDPVLDHIAEAARAGLRCLLLGPSGPAVGYEATQALRVLEVCRDTGVRLMLKGSISDALRLGAHGVYLDEPALKQVQPGQVPAGLLMAAACHSPLSLEYAARLGADFAVLAPVRAPSANLSGLSSAGAGLGWHRVRKWVRGAALPVFAQGGLCGDDLSRAVECGCQGIVLGDPARAPCAHDGLQALKMGLGQPL